jgi:hypothetical protein
MESCKILPDNYWQELAYEQGYASVYDFLYTEYWIRGNNASRIAQKFYITASMVYHQFKKHGIRLKKHGGHNKGKRYTIKQRNSTDNSCRICGDDKGANRWYCGVCHSQLSNAYDETMMVSAVSGIKV